MIRLTGAGQEQWCAVVWVVRAWCPKPNGDPSLDHCKRRSNCPARTPDLAPLILKFCFPCRQEVLRHDGIYMCIGTSHSYGMEHLQLTTGFRLIPMMLLVDMRRVYSFITWGTATLFYHRFLLLLVRGGPLWRFELSRLLLINAFNSLDVWESDASSKKSHLLCPSEESFNSFFRLINDSKK